MSRRWCLLVLGFALAGCSGGSVDDLHSYVEEVKASRKGRVPPLPEFIPVENFTYAAIKMGDPFVSWQAKAARLAKVEQHSKQGSGFQPDLGRRREALEGFPLDTLRMVGTLQRKDESAVLVKSPDGLISRVTVGNYIGHNHGRVVAINPDKVDLIEIVPDGLGGWQKRPASLAITE